MVTKSRHFNAGQLACLNDSGTGGNGGLAAIDGNADGILSRGGLGKANGDEAGGSGGETKQSGGNIHGELAVRSIGLLNVAKQIGNSSDPSAQIDAFCC